MELVRTSGRSVAVRFVIALLLTGLGFAVRYGEDNHLGESNVISFYVFITAGLFAYWTFLGFLILSLRYLKKRRR